MSDRIDQARNLWEERRIVSGYCLCVTGSVARAEQTEFSDIDLLIIQSEIKQIQGEGSESVDAIVGELSRSLDHVSVVVRSVHDISAIIDTDIRSWVAQMDALLIAGDVAVYQAFRDSLRTAVKERRRNILIALESLTRERHQQYGSAVSLLEPNIKNSAGTLRDIHTIYYIGLLDVIAASNSGADPLPGVRRILEKASLSRARIHALIDAYEFFLAVRASMHLHSGHLHDSLDFELQRSVAASMGMRSHDEKKNIERFMRAYYAHARAVHVSVQLVFHDGNIACGLDEDVRNAQQTPIDPGFSLDPDGAMELFLDMAAGRIQPSGAIIRGLDTLRGKPFDAKVIRRFDEILRTGTRVAPTLMFMHEHGMLSAVLPEFASLEHFFQHNVYHFFTVDEHTLRAIHATETLLREDGHTARILENISDPSVLYYAILLHDIAKPIDLAHHEHVGADLVPRVLQRYGRRDIIDIVAFLVREHLRMEQLAFRRNFREITSLQPFLDVVDTEERLDLLYLLTLADMAALNPGVLTDWKRELLRELHVVATRHLSSKGADVSPGILEHADGEGSMFDRDGRDFSVAVQDIVDGELVRMDIRHHRAFSEVTVFCLDRPQLLSQFAAALFGADCSIVDASIETRHDVVIDTFRVVDIITDSHLRVEQGALLRTLLRAVCAGELDASAVFDRYRRKWIRKLRKMPKANIPMDVRYLPHHAANGEEQTIVEVYAPDAFGLLYLLSAELSLFGLDVVFAKIATRVDGVVDSFYVVDEHGHAFTDSTRREQLRHRLLEKIHTLVE